MSDDLVGLAHRSDGAERDPGPVCAKWFRGGLRHAIRTSYVAAVLAADRAPGLSAELALHLTSVGFTAADIDRLVPWVADVADVSRGDASDWWDAVGLLASSGWSAADIAAMPALKTSAYGNQFGSPAEAVRLLAY
ncbi:MAG: hypothetical protein GY701_11365, partial [Sulfitobacter sp.]|nr:hypothetical protein [Sulfitobacter sp.]